MNSTLATKDKLTRRNFLSVGIPMLWSPLFKDISRTGVLSEQQRDPRLTARPGRPTIPAPRGAVIVETEKGQGGILYVPERYQPTTPAPLIVALHGGGGRARTWERLYESCEESGIVLLAPE